MFRKGLTRLHAGEAQLLYDFGHLVVLAVDFGGVVTGPAQVALVGHVGYRRAHLRVVFDERERDVQFAAAAVGMKAVLRHRGADVA